MVLLSRKHNGGGSSNSSSNGNQHQSFQSQPHSNRGNSQGSRGRQNTLDKTMEEKSIIEDLSQIGVLEILVNLSVKYVESLDTLLLIAGRGTIKNSNLPYDILIITTRHLCERWLLHLALPLTSAGTLVLVQRINLLLI